MKSSQLVRELMKQGYLKRITTFHYDITKGDDVDEIINYFLHYDEKSCTQRIAPLKTKDAKKQKDYPTYWVVDFEADTSGDVHLCCLKNMNGEITKIYHGCDCYIKLLEYLPNEAVVLKTCIIT